MMKRIFSVLAFIVVVFSASAYAQSVSFTASAKNVVEVGERFRLTYSVNAEGKNFKVPPITGLSLLSGPNQSSSSSVQIINGQMSQQVENAYSYILVANTEGKFTIPAAEIVVNSKTYRSNSLSIEVVKASAATQQNQQAQQQAQQTSGSNISADDLFVKVSLSKTEVYVGEPIVATLKVYTRAKLSNIGEFKFPSFSGFYSSVLQEVDRITLERENINGKVYETGLFRKLLLYPQKAGQIEIEPFELECILLEQVGRRSFFDSGYREFSKKIKSKPTKVTVKPLPDNKPADFSGAVGDFNFIVSIDKTNVKENEAINLKLTVSGIGNIKLVEVPQFEIPTDFDTYDPKINLNVNNTPTGAKGSKTFEYLIIPRHAGEFSVPAITFSYFDLASKRYKEITSQVISIQVAKGTGGDAAAVVQGYTKEDVKFIGKDIHYQKTGVLEINRRNSFLWGSIGVISTYVILIALFIVLIVWKRKQIKENQNIAKVKNKQASKLSRIRLKAAALHLKDNKNEEFYDEVMKALWGYMSYKLNIQLSNLTKDRVVEELGVRKVHQETLILFKSIVEYCEFARYAPSSGEDVKHKIYDQAVELINTLEQNLR